jgi:hypothetical protein
MSRRYKVGRTTVEADRRGYVTYFERDGVSVPCVCDPGPGEEADPGQDRLVCKHHAAQLSEAERAAYDEANGAGVGEPPRWHPLRGPEQPQETS